MLVTGAGPVGLLAALLGAQRGLEVHVFDRSDATGRSPSWCARSAPPITPAISASCQAPDIVIECTGAAPSCSTPIAARRAGRHHLPCRRIGAAAISVDFDIGALNRNMVLENDVVFGIVNANRRHYATAADALARADRPGSTA